MVKFRAAGSLSSRVGRIGPEIGLLK